MATDDIHAYRNVVTGDVFVFATERPDLKVGAQFEEFPVDEVPDALKDAARRELAGARSIHPEQSPAPVTMNSPDPSLGYHQTQASGVTIRDGVLSRNQIRAVKTQAEMAEQAIADSESLALHGVLAAHVEDETTETRVNLGGPEIDVVNPEPAGDVKNSPVKRAGRAEAKRQQAKTAAPQNPPKTP
jgi:hypothetical protein